MRLALLLLPLLVPAAHAQCTIEWAAPVSGLWESPSNWNEARVPGDTDTACIIQEGEYAVELRGPRIVSGLVVGAGTTATPTGPRLEISDDAGHLIVNGPLNVRGSGELFVDFFSSTPGSFGVLELNGDGTIDGRFLWEGSVEGAGTLTVNGPTALGGITGTFARLHTTLVNTGVMTQTQNATLRFYGDGVLDNRGTLVWQQADDAEISITSVGSGDPGAILNSGTFRQAGASTLRVFVPMTNTGTLDVQSSTLELLRTSSHAGAEIVVADGATLLLSNQNAPSPPIYSVDVATTADIAGTLEVSGDATLDLSANWTIAGSLLLSLTSTLRGSGDLTTAGFGWGNRSVIEGSGTFRVTGANPIPNAGSYGGTLDGRSLRLAGSVGVNSPISLEDGAQLLVEDGGSLALFPVSFGFSLQSADGTGSVVNEGTIETASSIDFAVPVESSGTMSVAPLSGFPGEARILAPFACTGLIDLQGGEFQARGGDVSADGCTATGPGRLLVRDDGSLLVDGGGLTLEGGAQLLVQGNGDNRLLGTGPLAITDGSATNVGTLQPGLSPGTFSVVGDFAQTGTLEIELGGGAPGSEHDQLAATGAVTFGGDLEVVVLDGYQPTEGDRFVIATCGGGCSGAFDSIVVPDGYQFSTLFGTDQVELVADVVPVSSEDGPEAPVALGLSAPAPNPANGRARVTLSLSTGQEMTLEVLDALGRRVAQVHAGPMAAGSRTFALDASAWSPGVYVVRAVGEGAVYTRKLTVAR